jgi:hypothetical protein
MQEALGSNIAAYMHEMPKNSHETVVSAVIAYVPQYKQPRSNRLPKACHIACPIAMMYKIPIRMLK